MEDMAGCVQNQESAVRSSSYNFYVKKIDFKAVLNVVVLQGVK